MKIICVNYLIILLAFKFVNADENSTLIDKLEEEVSTVLPIPVDSTKPTIIESNQTNQFDLTIKSTIDDENFSKDKLENLKTSVNQSSSDLSGRSRTSKLLASSTLPFGTKLKRKPVDFNKNQTVTNVDLHSNMTVISGRAAFDDSQSKSNNDAFYGDHLSAYDKIKIKNDKFSYDNFFELYDQNLNDEQQQQQDDSKSQFTLNQS